MSVFTFSPVVLPKCETSWGEGFVLCPRPSLSLLLSSSHSPSCQAPSTLPNLPSLSHHPAPWGSLCSALASSPTTCFALLTPSLLSPFVVICFVSKEVRCRGSLGFIPLHSASGQGAGPDVICSHFCAEVKRPRRRTSFCPLTVLGDAFLLSRRL